MVCASNGVCSVSMYGGRCRPWAKFARPSPISILNIFRAFYKTLEGPWWLPIGAVWRSVTLPFRGLRHAATCGPRWKVLDFMIKKTLDYNYVTDFSDQWCRRRGFRRCKSTPKRFDFSTVLAKSLRIWAEMAPNDVWFQKMVTNIFRKAHEDFFW